MEARRAASRDGRFSERRSGAQSVALLVVAGAFAVELALDDRVAARDPRRTGRISGMATTEPRKTTPTDAWREEVYEATPERQGELFSTIGGIENDPLYSPDSVDVDYDRDLGYPGVYPFTRGVYPSMYRGKLWTMRQFAGFGTAEETNERFRYLLEHGQTGLSTAFDMPTLMGYDSDHARSLGEVGREGVAIDSLETWRRSSTGSRSARSRRR